MTKQRSFSKYENEILPDFRNKINKAESAEDVKKFFVYAANDLMTKAFAGEITFEYGDIMLTPEEEPLFAVNERLLASREFAEVWKNSDLPHVTGRLAQSAANRYKHLEKHPEKTNSKIRM